MKTVSIIISVTIAMFFTSYATAYTYNARYAENAPVIDGTISAGEWDNALIFTMSYPAVLSAPYNGAMPVSPFVTPTSDADLSADIYMSWDNDNLYVAFRVYDNDHGWLNSSPGPYNSQDAVQILFNPSNLFGTNYAGGKASIIDFAAQTADTAGAGFYGRNDEVFQNDQNIIVAGSVLADGYVIEIKFVNQAFGITPVIGESVGMGIILSDADANLHETLVADYGNGTFSVSDTTKWNTFKFIGSDGCGLYGFANADINKDCNVSLYDFSMVAGEWLKSTAVED